MINFTKSLLRRIGKLFPWRENRYLQSIRAYMLSGRITASLKHFGNQSVISPPIRLLGGKYISVGNKCIFGHHGVLTAWAQFRGDNFAPSIEIGDHVNIGDYFHIPAINRVRIGNGVLTGRWVTISDNAHGTTDNDSLVQIPMERKLFSKGPVVIGDNVWIGDKATILAGVTIGEGAVIGATQSSPKTYPHTALPSATLRESLKKLSDNDFSNRKRPPLSHHPAGLLA